MHISQSRRNLITLANVVEVATQSIIRTVNNGSVKEVGGIKQTKQVISDTVAAKLNARLSSVAGGVK